MGHIKPIYNLHKNNGTYVAQLRLKGKSKGWSTLKFDNFTFLIFFPFCSRIATFCFQWCKIYSCMCICSSTKCVGVRVCIEDQTEHSENSVQYRKLLAKVLFFTCSYLKIISLYVMNVSTRVLSHTCSTFLSDSSPLLKSM